MTEIQNAIYPSLRGRAVFITGGGGGIGASLVRHFAEQHCKVVFVDIDQAGGEAVVREVAGDHPAPLFIQCDLRDIAALKAAIAKGRDAVGDFTVLVNNAAHDERHDTMAVTPEYWDERLAVNLRHQFFAAQAIIPMMQAAGGGAIVNFGSTSWHLSQGGMPAYVTAKAGIEALTRSLARDYGPDGIRANCILPGWIMTKRQIEKWLTPEGEADLLKRQCLKEKLAPADCARMALWLAADDSRLITAHNFYVDAGAV
ncbi:MAG: 3-oxoacyl-ACP reductase [Acidiphilium sp. 37-64-53]|uniref:SDR family NAD(P)-dependent oxidoreductase n=1 Tax=Acidiphilium TaxID=522 RepID=UPI000BDD81B6|nr:MULTISPECIES: SDR family oxidoreductase [Acidiphilium]OYW01765.1 MAG: 3-oxoacyl-ACP reductase [Acidiphilium sp. 37-64-53]OZB29671.1 MAG: 3-oxoacyl-ACP reductase [Acidiphilium sp. 34-64-41]HQT85694.1 SDR family oxidoreductase [Acidiphilium rubrum]